MAMVMEFCPKCGTVLIPVKVGRCKRLTCPRCGYKGKVKKLSSYKISEKGKEAQEVAIIEEKKAKKRPIVNEYEIEPPEYDEEMYG
ncbi:MAG: DNA-directed RNA polymerase [Hadesarchaea archaeon]|nr:DNA-directed RNA polymerase [Hadesarchaea archaeon]